MMIGPSSHSSFTKCTVQPEKLALFLEANGYGRANTVMEPGAAAMILAVGLIDGMFRPAKGTLFDYFNATTQDWYGARELVNGDKAKKSKWAGGKRIGDLIAGYGKGFAMALKYK